MCLIAPAFLPLTEPSWIEIRHRPRYAPRPLAILERGDAFAMVLGLAKLRLSEIEPFSWADSSWGLSTGSFARAVVKITHHR